MLGQYRFRPGEIRNRARYLQHAIVTARAQAKLLHAAPEHFASPGIRPAYVRNGAIYLAHRHTVAGGSVWGSPELPYEMPPERSVNIDEPLDFLLAEAVLRAGLTEIDLLLEGPREGS